MVKTFFLLNSTIFSDNNNHMYILLLFLVLEQSKNMIVTKV